MQLLKGHSALLPWDAGEGAGPGRKPPPHLQGQSGRQHAAGGEADGEAQEEKDPPPQELHHEHLQGRGHGASREVQEAAGRGGHTSAYGCLHRKPPHSPFWGAFVRRSGRAMPPAAATPPSPAVSSASGTGSSPKCQPRHTVEASRVRGQGLHPGGGVHRLASDRSPEAGDEDLRHLRWSSLPSWGPPTLQRPPSPEAVGDSRHRRSSAR